MNDQDRQLGKGALKLQLYRDTNQWFYGGRTVAVARVAMEILVLFIIVILQQVHHRWRQLLTQASLVSRETTL